MNDNGADIILKTRNLKKTYMQGKIPVHALQGVDIEVERGELISIVGPSGSGKSTLLSLIGMLDIATEGDVFIDGIEVTKSKEKANPKMANELFSKVLKG
ncbi:MAG: ATP-binding cassette domain-containing protein [Nitrospirae bacterium]|nr:ATP-binding cassette domain-containing protein [Nitrospirota bacterium]